MKKRSRRISKKKDFLSASSVSLIILSMLMTLYLVSSSISDIQFAGFLGPSPCEDGTAEVSLLNSEFVNNAIVIYITSPNCAMATANINIGVPRDIDVDLENIQTTGAFANMVVRGKNKGVNLLDDDMELNISYFDLKPSSLEGTITIPFSASNPGDFKFSAKSRIRFMDADGNRINIVFHIPKLVLKMFNFSFYVQPSMTTGAINKVPVGGFGDAVLNTTIAGSFGFNLGVSDGVTALNKLTTVTTQNPVYKWEKSFDSYLHPENKDTCNARKVNASVILNYNNNIVTNSIEVELTKPELSDIYAVIDQYFNSIGTDSEDPTLIPRTYYMVGSYFNC